MDCLPHKYISPKYFCNSFTNHDILVMRGELLVVYINTINGGIEINVWYQFYKDNVAV